MAPRSKGNRRLLFDAYCVVDFSASSTPVLGPNSIWWALLRFDGRRPLLEFGNCATRDALESELASRLVGPLAGMRVLVGFDFPFGFPRGLAAALGHKGRPGEAWRSVWNRICQEVRDDHRNGNNRFEVASRLNSEVSRGFGPFFGRPPKASEAVADHLSPRRDGFFRFPLSLRNGSQVLALRETDLRARSSSPWFLFGDPNSAGGQALVGIPRVARLREAIPGARIWPFETGGMTKGLAPARVLLAEVYPSLFHRRQAGREIHDRLQVESSVLAFARLDAQGFLAKLFATPKDPSIVHEEGWILG